MASPSIQKLEERLFTLLTQEFNVTVTPIHPKKEKSLNKDDFIVVISYVSDSFEGSSITPLILHPRMSFSVYAISYPTCRDKGENLVEFLDSLSGLEFQEDNQKVDVVHRLSRSPISFDEESRLHLINYDYRFIISRTNFES